MFKGIENWLEKLGDRVLFNGKLKGLVEYSESFKLLQGTLKAKFKAKLQLKRELACLLDVLEDNYVIEYKPTDEYSRTKFMSLPVIMKDVGGLKYNYPFSDIPHEVIGGGSLKIFNKRKFLKSLDQASYNYSHEKPKTMVINKIKIRYDGIDGHGFIIDIFNNEIYDPLVTYKPIRVNWDTMPFFPFANPYPKPNKLKDLSLGEAALIDILRKEWQNYNLKLDEKDYVFIIRLSNLISDDKPLIDILSDLYKELEKSKEYGYVDGKLVDGFFKANLIDLARKIDEAVGLYNDERANAILLLEKHKKHFGSRNFV